MQQFYQINLKYQCENLKMKIVFLDEKKTTHGDTLNYLLRNPYLINLSTKKKNIHIQISKYLYKDLSNNKLSSQIKQQQIVENHLSSKYNIVQQIQKRHFFYKLEFVIKFSLHPMKSNDSQANHLSKSPVSDPQKKQVYNNNLFPKNRDAKTVGVRAMLKNDNFYLATQKQNQQKKKKQELLKQTKPGQKLTAEQRIKYSEIKKQQKLKNKIKIQDRQLFQQNENNYHIRFGFDQFCGTNQKSKREQEDFELFRKRLTKKKEKMNLQENGNVEVSQHQPEIKKQIMENKKEDQKVRMKDVAEKKDNSQDDEDNFDDLLQALKTHEKQEPKQKQQNKNEKQQSLIKVNPFKRTTIFKPKSTIIQTLPEPTTKLASQKPKSAYETNKQRLMFEKKMKKQLGEIKEKNQQGQNKQGGVGEKQKKEPTKKKIKKVNNYQRLDLNRRFKDRFVGGLRDNQRKFMKNGVLKPKYRMAQSQLQMDQSQIYNTYIHSLSRSFKVQVIIDSESEEVELEAERSVEIPMVGDCTKERLQVLIKQLFGFEQFRQGQYQVTNNILHKQSTLFISQTASGKSLTYILSSLIMSRNYSGMSIVISPLIALMLDQLQHLPDQLPAVCISSLVNYQQRQNILNLVKTNQVKLLFMTPQMLLTDILFHLAQFPKINFLCIDEAHCLSELSQNFRTSYMALTEIIKNHIHYNNEESKPNILCLTATANTQTITSLKQKLDIKHVVKSSSTINKNLYITITREKLQQDKYKALVQYLRNPQIRQCQGILIYCRSKWVIEKVFYYLSNEGISTVVFHGQLTAKQKTKIISEFKSRMIRIIISTTALGMGLDFEHLDCIVHFNMAKSLQSYVQEIGRAGRRQTRAYCHLFLNEYDFFTQRNYILADELQKQSLNIIITEIKRAYRVIKQCNKHKIINNKQKKNNNKLIQQQNCQSEMIMDRVIKKASLAIQKMQQNNKQQQALQQQLQSDIFYDDEDQQSISLLNSENNNHNDQNQMGLYEQQQQWAPLYYLRSKQLSQKTYLRQQSLLGILMKLASLLNLQLSKQFNPSSLTKNEIMKIHPLSHQTLKLSFFKTNQKQLIQSAQYGHFYRQLVDYNQQQKNPQCKKANGAYFIHVIDKCNQLRITPIQLMRKIYEIANCFVMKVEFVNQCYVFSLKNKVKVEKWQRIKKRLITRYLHDEQFQKSVIDSVNHVQNTAMIKLQVFYSLAFDHSLISISQILRKKFIISRSQPIPTHNIMTKITKYFNSDLLSFYHQLMDTKDQNDRQMFLPTESIEPTQIRTICDCVKLFFKHQFSNLRDLRNPDQALRKKNAVIEQFKDGKVITRVFLGVNQQKSSRFIYGEHSYWKKFQKKKYFQLLKTVKDFIQQEREEIMEC